MVTINVGQIGRKSSPQSSRHTKCGRPGKTASGCRHPTKIVGTSAAAVFLPVFRQFEARLASCRLIKGVALNHRVCPQQSEPAAIGGHYPEHTTTRHSKFMKPGDAKALTRSAASAWECTPVPCDGPGTGDGGDTAIQQRGSGDGAWLRRSISRGPSGLLDPGRIAQPCLGHADLVPDGSRAIGSGESGSYHRTTPLASCGRSMSLPRSSWHTSLRAPGVRPPPRSHSPSASPLCAPQSSRTPAAAGARRS